MSMEQRRLSIAMRHIATSRRVGALIAFAIKPVATASGTA
jgi:hypothetical protein